MKIDVLFVPEVRHIYLDAKASAASVTASRVLAFLTAAPAACLLAIVPITLCVCRIRPVPTQTGSRNYRNSGRGNDRAESDASNHGAKIRATRPRTDRTYADTDPHTSVDVYIPIAVHVHIRVAIDVHVRVPVDVTVYICVAAYIHVAVHMAAATGSSTATTAAHIDQQIRTIDRGQERRR